MATRAEVLNAYATTPGASVPDESAINYWMQNGLGPFAGTVAAVNAAQPTGGLPSSNPSTATDPYAGKSIYDLLQTDNPLSAQLKQNYTDFATYNKPLVYDEAGNPSIAPATTEDYKNLLDSYGNQQFYSNPTGVNDKGTNIQMADYSIDSNGNVVRNDRWQDVRGDGWLSQNIEGIVKSVISSIATAGLTPGLTEVFGPTALGKAATQAVVNGVSSAIQGQDVLKGMVTGALGSAGSTFVGNQIGKVVEDVTQNVAKDIAGVELSKATTDALGNGVTGGLKAAISGQDIAKGALTGAAGSYLNTTISGQLKDMFPDNPNLDKAAAKFISSGLINPSSVTNPASLIKAMTSAWSAMSADEKAAAGVTKEDEQAITGNTSKTDDTNSGLSTLDDAANNRVLVTGNSLGTGDYTPAPLDQSLVQDAVTGLPAVGNTQELVVTGNKADNTDYSGLYAGRDVSGTGDVGANNTVTVTGKKPGEVDYSGLDSVYTPPPLDTSLIQPVINLPTDLVDPTIPTITVTGKKPVPVEPDYVPPDPVIDPYIPTLAPTVEPTVAPTAAPTAAPTGLPTAPPTVAPKKKAAAPVASGEGCSKIPWLDSSDSILKNAIVNKKNPLAQQSLQNIYGRGDEGVPEINLDPFGAMNGGSINKYASGGEIKCLNQDPNLMPRFIDCKSELLQPMGKSKNQGLSLKQLAQLKENISPLGHMGSINNLASGGLPNKYHDAMPKGHNPEFVTGLTGYYACGGGTGQSDDIPAMLHDGDYVMDADVVASLGDGSSKAGREVLDGFRKKVPHQDKAEGHPVPAKIADGEYVFPAGFVTALGGGDNKEGAKILNGLREKLRAHKRSAPTSKIPPKAKSPLDYIKQAKG